MFCALDVECASRMLRIVAPRILTEHKKRGAPLASCVYFFKQISCIQDRKLVDMRTRFMCMDIVESSDRKWIHQPSVHKETQSQEIVQVKVPARQEGDNHKARLVRSSSSLALELFSSSRPPNNNKTSLEQFQFKSVLRPIPIRQAASESPVELLSSPLTLSGLSSPTCLPSPSMYVPVDESSSESENEEPLFMKREIRTRPGVIAAKV
jgi:hypothetical protein